MDQRKASTDPIGCDPHPPNEKRAYEAPRIVWENEFVALAGVSDPGSCSDPIPPPWC